MVEIKENWRGKRDTVDLDDVHACPPSKATAGQLVAANRKSARPRVCEDCGAHCQRPLPQHSEDDPRRLCPACRQIARLRERQAELAQLRAQLRAQHSYWAAKVLAWEAGAAVQVDLTVPPPSDGGRKRPATAGRIRAVDLTGRRLVDITVRLVGPRARWVPDHAVPAEQGVPKVHQALLGRSLILWAPGEMEALQAAAPHETWRPQVPHWQLKPDEQPPERAPWTTDLRGVTSLSGPARPAARCARRDAGPATPAGARPPPSTSSRHAGTVDRGGTHPTNQCTPPHRRRTTCSRLAAVFVRDVDPSLSHPTRRRPTPEVSRPPIGRAAKSGIWLPGNQPAEEHPHERALVVDHSRPTRIWD